MLSLIVPKITFPYNLLCSVSFTRSPNAFNRSKVSLSSVSTLIATETTLSSVLFCVIF